MLFTDEIVIRALVQGAITLPEALTVLDTGSESAQGDQHQRTGNADMTTETQTESWYWSESGHGYCPDCAACCEPSEIELEDDVPVAYCDNCGKFRSA